MREGRIKHREHVVEGLDNTSNTFIDLCDLTQAFVSNQVQ
jgi:NADPH-dependent curcumin reductase CurA